MGRTKWLMLGAYVAGVASLYLAGPAVGRRLQVSGARLAGMEATTAVVEMDANVTDEIRRIVSREVQAVAGRKLGPMPADWGKR